MNSAVPIACDLGALSTPERQRRFALAARIRERVIASTESETGFRLQLSTDDASYTEVLELIFLDMPPYSLRAGLNGSSREKLTFRNPRFHSDPGRFHPILGHLAP